MSIWNTWEAGGIEWGWWLVSASLCLLWFVHEKRLNRAFRRAVVESIAMEKACGELHLASSHQAPVNSNPEVSVIVCIRNGKNDWEGLWESLKKQKFSGDWEVIAVDDGSTDETPGLLEQSMKEVTSFGFRHYRLEHSRPGKKDALAFGLAQAKGDCVLLTDVDGIPSSETWVCLMTHAIRAHQKDVVLGLSWPVVDSNENSWWLKMTQALDAMRIARSYIGWAERGEAYMGVGRNMAIRKSIHPGFEAHAHLASGDDDLMIQELMRRSEIRVGTMISRKAQIDSPLPNSWNGWARQKKRHWSTTHQYSRKHQWNLSKPLLLMAGVGWCVLQGLVNSEGDGVLHISLWIVALLMGFIWTTEVLTFRLVAKACQAPTKWQQAGWFQPLLFVWSLKTAIWTRLVKQSETSW